MLTTHASDPEMIINADGNMVDIQTLIPINRAEDTHVRIYSDLRNTKLKFIVVFYHEKGDEKCCFVESFHKSFNKSLHQRFDKKLGEGGGERDERIVS